MKKITFKKTEHNGLECWKDSTGLFMIVKNLGYYGEKPHFDLFIAKSDCSQLTNECHSWSFEKLYNKGFDTKKDAIYEAELIVNFISDSYGLFNDYQYKLIYNTYFEELNA